MVELEDQSRTDAVRFGDWVCLYCEESRGFIHSFQSSSAHNELAVGIDQHRWNPAIPNLHAAVFQLCVQNRYKFDKEVNQIKSQLDKDPENVFLQNHFAQTKSAAEAESHDNQTEQQRQAGKRLLYGQIIQLCHKYTRKYLHVNASKTSSTETSNMLDVNLFADVGSLGLFIKVELLSTNGKTALFRIMPRYKVKAEGDVVQVEDHVVLESMKSPGQYLHCSLETFDNRSVYSESHELNLSVRPSAFTVYFHQRPQAKPSQKTPSVLEAKVGGGAVVRLYHRELEAYVVAEGLPELKRFEGVHLRVRPIIHNISKTLYPSSSAITYWQVEKERSSIDGGLIVWEEHCRLRHVTTRQYLMVNEEGEVGLTADHLDPNVVFRFHPVIKETEAVPYDSLVRLEHVISGFWLHADGSNAYERKLVNENQSSVESLCWTTADLKQLVALEEMMYNDAFLLQRVDEQLVLDANYMAGMVPFLQKLIFDLENEQQFTSRSLAPVLNALQELKQFMLVDGMDCKRHQKLLRNFMVVDLVVELLKLQINKNDNEQLIGSVFAESYCLLYNYLRGDSRKNELYMAQHLEFFIKQLSASV